ncbi:uncharacterized protein LOC132282224 [Cornus florida]|uniref:uncharacterized protein LOC132282224 n=1 Tax=Cornus florida TaxID=4283 RepID=UPI00289C2328|nr:uncharacterized protein LOC132282224 [Cornus florida]
MDRSEISHPIGTTLEGCSNYILWSQAMSSFLKGKKLWRIITGDLFEPVQVETETKEKYGDRLEEWDSKNHQIITWFRNTCISSISIEFGRFNYAKSIWDFLKHRYTTTDLAHQYQLLTNLHSKTQQPGQSISTFVSEIHAIWDQLSLSEPTWSCATDATKFTTYRDRQRVICQRVIMFLMALQPSFEPVRASLLHRHPLPTLEDAITELLSKETRLNTSQPQVTDAALATHYPRKKPASSFSSPKECTYCHNTDHALLTCPTRICKFCHKKGPGHYQSDCPKNWQSRTNSSRGTSSSYRHPSSSFTVVTAEGSCPPAPTVTTMSTNDIEALLKQILSNNGTPHSTAMSVTSGNSWFFDSGCCNHMTSDSTMFSKHNPTINTPTIHTADGSHLHDPQTGQTFGIGRKVGRLFELIHLRIPSHRLSTVSTVASATSTPSLSLWHSRLSHVSIGRLRSLVSTGQLGSVKIDDLYLMKNRSELPQLYYDFANMVKTQFSRSIKIFRADNAMEYNKTNFLKFLRQHGTISHSSCPGTSQQNGRAERKHRHILDTVRSLLISSSCPERFWGEAALTTVYTINRVPMHIIGNQSPYERLYRILPAYNLLKVFGCACFVLLQPHERTKLEPRARLCCFLGYRIKHKGYRCWDPISKRLRISRHVIFWEHKIFSSLSKFHLSSSSTPSFFTDSSVELFPVDTDIISSSEIPTTTPDTTSPSELPQMALLDEYASSDVHATESLSELPQMALPNESVSSDGPATESSSSDIITTAKPPHRVRKPPSHLRDFQCFSIIMSHHEPQSYREASSNPLWQQAMAEELQALAQA